MIVRESLGVFCLLPNNHLGVIELDDSSRIVQFRYTYPAAVEPTFENLLALSHLADSRSPFALLRSFPNEVDYLVKQAVYSSALRSVADQLESTVAQWVVNRIFAVRCEGAHTASTIRNITNPIICGGASLETLEPYRLFTVETYTRWRNRNEIT